MQQCGFCSLLSSLIRHTMCAGSRRGSSDSCYKEIGEEETTRKRKPERTRSRFTTSWFKRHGDKVSIRSSDTEEIVEDIVPMRKFYDPPQRSKESVGRFMANMNEIKDLSDKKMLTGRFLSLHKKRRKQLVTRSLSEAGLIDDILFGQVDYILYKSAAWRFNAFTLDNVSGGRCLPVLSIYLFQVYDLIPYFKLDAAKVWKLFIIIDEGYHSTNPYHNSVHAADVTQAMHCFLQQSQIIKYLEPVEIMASLLAAMAHDLDHPGVNQSFLIATSNHLAALYENSSVLENHHWRAAMSCLKESGVFDDMPDLYHGLRAQISSLIMATDITRQQEYLSKFKNHLDTNTLDLTKKENRHLVLQMALKCADISNPCRPWETSFKWSVKVCEEFFRQGDYERNLNLPITALCDRHIHSIPKIQTGFFKFIVTPLITEWHRFLQNDLSTEMLQNLIYNRCNWEYLDTQEIIKAMKSEASDKGVVKDDAEACSRTDLSASSELLLPPRKSSLGPVEQSTFKENLRRFSAPLNVLQDYKFWNIEKRRTSSGAKSYRETSSLLGSEQSLQSHLSFRFQCTEEISEKNWSEEKLLPHSSITSVTTPLKSTQKITSLNKKDMWNLQKQQTSPPPCTTTKAHAFEKDMEKYSDSFKDEKDELVSTVKETLSAGILKTSDIKKVELIGSTEKVEKQIETILKDSDETKDEQKTDPDTLEKELRENLAAAQRGGITLASLLPRRESLPTDILSFSQNVKNMREITSAIPQLLCQDISVQEYWTRRRGSAPAPIAPSDLRVLSTLGPIKHCVTGGPWKPSSIASCQQSFARAHYGAQEGSIPLFPRRSSLPVEVITGISSR